ncbi:nitrate- and nitrite sensing domain-containing protein [Streptomyces sp. GXMU-J5]|uniref:histidine kinase n=1 Tax=Streptomyces beihaiensis TaxID=2984495 RepID=A0ABT3TS66_9ACTN|nr:nitrate- and nitrite sensing domain-containing protein [Streptomyces beihaiensis]MCX3059876.1 nitrate- and nitrite sensing domain-containing protein [Streptomyces beihaiensis]
MRRSKKSPAPASARGNFTPPSRTAPQAAPAAEEAVPAPSGGRMSPRNWRVPAKLNAILLIPVIVGLVMGGFQVKSSLDTWHEAQDAEHTARLVQAALTYGNRLIEERDISAAPLLQGERDDPKVASARQATDSAADAFHEAAKSMPHKPGLERRMAAFTKVESGLGKLRAAAYTSKLGDVRTEEGYVAIQHPLMEFANELGLGTGNITSYGRTVYAISLSKAALSLERSIGMHLLVKPGPSAAAFAKQRTALGSYAYLEGIAVEEYKGGGTPQDLENLQAAQKRLKADGAKQVAAAKSKDPSYVAPPADMVADLVGLPSTAKSARAALAAKGVTPQNWWAVNTARFDAYRTIESDLADKAVNEASGIADDARRQAMITGGAVLLALLAAFLLAGQMARQMSRSMRRLRTAAFDVAEQRLPMLVDQLSRTEPGRVDTRVQPIPINTTDEIGEVARAFDQVHREAVRLAAEQAMLRGNINAIFTNLSRRNQSLIEGQLTLITDLENNEADPDQLESLFRLDHLATRMRRNGENLLVLAGEEPGRRWDQPVPLVDVLRAATSEVEQYERIELSGVPEADIHGRAVTDLVHLLAELLENATSFSSPQTKVRVTATRLPDGRIMVEIHDKGIGLTAEDFADINHKLANPPTVDAAISQRMGLFVVGRLSDRHGIRVQLRPSGEQAGTTSLVMLPDAITHGGGGQTEDHGEFTVSTMIPHQPAAFEKAPLRTAAELGFDDSRYEVPDDARELDPVGRSLMREERRAALEAQQAQNPQQSQQSPQQTPQQPQAPAEPRRPEWQAPEPYGQESYGQEPDAYTEPERETPQADPQDAFRRDSYAPDTYGQDGFGQDTYPEEPFRREPFGGDEQDAYARDSYTRDAYTQDSYAQESYARDSYAQDSYPSYDAFGGGRDAQAATAPSAPEREDGFRPAFAPETESVQVADAAEPESVGFDAHGRSTPDGPSSSVPHELTDAGLPRRGSAAPQRPEPSAPAAGTGDDDTTDGTWRSANDERWSRAGQLRQPKAGGVTASGLPRRVPRANLVEGTAESTVQGGPQVSRAPEDVRGRLSNLRRGVQRGRSEGSSDQQ